MAVEHSHPSLLPYLKAEKGRFRLNIALISSDRSVLERGPYPFRVVAESGPFARIIEGNILTDADSPVRPVFLLRQADHYPSLSDDIRPAVNPDVDRFWQEAYRWYRCGTAKSLAVDPPFLLAGQTDSDDRLIPCNPLLYCLLREIYFEALCPQCGWLLELCRRDEVLHAAGLQPYTTSLKRYLYCPQCARKSDGATFYVYQLEVDDPPGLKDRRALIHDLGNLLVRSDLADHFPCSACPEQIACYGPDNLSQKRIAAFAFYPFYLMVFDAATLPATDFVALLSGATLEQIKEQATGPGRRHTLEAAGPKLARSAAFLLSDRDPRHFLEVLFLKLCLLGEFSDWLLRRGGSPGYPDLPLSLNRVWVKLPDQAGLLPTLWNFKPIRFDVGPVGNIGSEPLRHASASGLYNLALVWFYSLLVNKHQNPRQVSEALDRICDELLSQAPPLTESFFEGVEAGAFRPENTFWVPADHTVAPEFDDLWRRALTLGADLLQAGLDREVPWSQESFKRRFDAFRDSVRQELFSAKQSAEQSDRAEPDTAILHILQNLLHKWRSEPRPLAAAEDMDATVLISKNMDADAETVVAAPGADNELQETVILSPQSPAGKPAERSAKPDPEETVMLSSRPPGSRPGADMEKPDDDLIQETVMLSPGASIPRPSGPKTTPLQPHQADLPETGIPSPDEEYLEETVIQRSVDSGGPDRRDAADRTHLEKTVVAKPSADKDQSPPPDLEDDLAETVIIKPKPSKSK